MKRIHKLLALFLILCMALSLSPAAFADGEPASVDSAEGEGSTGNDSVGQVVVGTLDTSLTNAEETIYGAFVTTGTGSVSVEGETGNLIVTTDTTGEMGENFKERVETDKIVVEVTVSVETE